MTDEHGELTQPAAEGGEYDMMLRLERLESLREEMDELGVTTVADIDDQIAALNRELDARERA